MVYFAPQHDSHQCSKWFKIIEVLQFRNFPSLFQWLAHCLTGMPIATFRHVLVQEQYSSALELCRSFENLSGHLVLSIILVNWVAAQKGIRECFPEYFVKGTCYFAHPGQFGGVIIRKISSHMSFGGYYCIQIINLVKSLQFICLVCKIS